MVNIKKSFSLNPFTFFSLLGLASIVSLVLMSHNLTSWKFAFVGDEWPFIDLAKHIVQQDFKINPFNLYGVHGGENRLFGSFWQAIFVYVFADNPHFGWRFSGVLLILPMAWGLYYFAKEYFSDKQAFIASLLLLFSAHLMNFFKIPYMQPLGMTFFIFSLWSAAWAGKSFELKRYLLLGVVLGLSFYVYIGPLYLLIVWPYLLPSITKPKRVLVNLCAMIMVYAAIVSIGFMTTPNYSMENISKKTVMREFSDNWQIVRNVFHFALSYFKNYGYGANHFVAGPLVDTTSGAIILGGMLISLIQIRKRPYLFLFLAYFSACTVFAVTSPYAYVPVTRSIFLLPFGFMFLAIGISHINSRYIVGTILAVIILTNIYHSHIGVFNDLGHNATTLIIKRLQEIRPPQRGIILILKPGSHFNYSNITAIKRFYGASEVHFEAVQAHISLDCSYVADKLLIYFDPGVKQYVSTIRCVEAQTERIYPLH